MSSYSNWHIFAKATFIGALKKVRKHVRRTIQDKDVDELHAILSRTYFKRITQIYDLLMEPRYEIAPENENLVLAVNDVENAIYSGPLSVNPQDVEANELIELFSKPHWKSFMEAYVEIATQKFLIPDIPENAFSRLSGIGTYGTLGSLAGSRVSNFQPNANHTSGQLYNAGSTQGLFEARKTEATLTGGGVGPALPPVDGALKIISFEKHPGENLGITVVQQQYMSDHYGRVKELVVKRILTASRIEQQGLLHEGDVIREANGVPVDNPQTLQRVLRNASGTVTLKIIPGYANTPATTQLFLRAYFYYNPQHDNLIPCKEAGLAFEAGDVLQIMKQDDPHWWQARHQGHQQRAGLIPSVVLQERRRAYHQSAPSPSEINYKLIACGLARRRRKEAVIPFRAAEADDFQTKDLVLYEEVALISGFQRPVVCFLGAQGVGRRSLRNMLIRTNRDKYAVALIHTSREIDPLEEEDDGQFVRETRENMELGRFKNKYIEFGEFEEHCYGTKYDSVRQIVQSGRTCLLDCSPQAVLHIRNAEFMPYVIFLAAPSVSCMKAMYEYGMSMGFTHKWKRDERFRSSLEESEYIEKNYRHLMDMILLCDNIESCFEKLSQCLKDLLVQPQWVPAKWLY